MITNEKLKLICQNTHITELTKHLNTYMSKYGITTEEQQNMFLAQSSHESGGFRVMIENLNYSEQGLKTIFGKYFTGIQAQLWARKPELIANKVYANRMGNGDALSGDGWRYRGRGYIQLTGKNNYQKFAESIGKSIDDTVKYLETMEGAVESACWFWKTNNLNSVSHDILLCTKKINGGTNGLAHRKELFEKISQF